MSMISVRRGHGGSAVAQKIVELVAAARALRARVIPVDDDIFDMAAVVPVFPTKCHPDRGVQ